jgi:hypothetical protein
VVNNNHINKKSTIESSEYTGGNVINDEHVSMSTELGDEQRVKVLSPGALVIKRFIRNRLAIVGFFIIAFMFLFSFVGSILSPYDEAEVFTYVGTMSKEYASVTQNNEFRYTVAEGKEYGSVEHSKFILAQNNGESFFNSGDSDYSIIEEGEEFYRITYVIPIADITYFKGLFDVMPFEGRDIDKNLETEIYNALESSKGQFEFEDEIYTLKQVKRDYVLGKLEDVAIESMLIIDPAKPDLKIDYDFKLAVEKVINTEGTNTFTVNDQSFEIEVTDGIASVYENKSGERAPYAVISDLAIQPVSPEIFLTIEFKTAIQQAISEELTSFSFTYSKNRIKTGHWFLKYHGYIVAPDFLHYFSWCLGNIINEIPSIKTYLTLYYLSLRSLNQLHQRQTGNRFSTSRFTYDTYGFTLGHIKRHTIYSFNSTNICKKVCMKIIKLNYIIRIIHHCSILCFWYVLTCILLFKGLGNLPVLLCNLSGFFG